MLQELRRYDLCIYVVQSRRKNRPVQAATVGVAPQPYVVKHIAARWRQNAPIERHGIANGKYPDG